MLVRMVYWEMIRENFTQAERDALNAAVVSRTICPKGLVVDEEALEVDLRCKLVNLLAEAKRRHDAPGMVRL